MTAQVRADRIHLKNLGAEAVARLTQLGVRSAGEVAEVADELADLVDDDNFWVSPWSQDPDVGSVVPGFQSRIDA